MRRQPPGHPRAEPAFQSRGACGKAEDPPHTQPPMNLLHPPSEPMQVCELPELLSDGLYSVQVPVGQRFEQGAEKGPVTLSVLVLIPRVRARHSPHVQVKACIRYVLKLPLGRKEHVCLRTLAGQDPQCAPMLDQATRVGHKPRACPLKLPSPI